MSVPVYRRKESDLEAYNRSRDLRVDVCKYLLNTKKLDSIPIEIRKEVYKDIYRSLSLICENITRANAIYPIIAREVDQRRLIQNVAITYAYAFKNHIMFLIDLLEEESKPKILFEFNEDIEEIIKMLKKWRAYNNRILENINNKQSI